MSSTHNVITITIRQYKDRIPKDLSRAAYNPYKPLL